MDQKDMPLETEICHNCKREVPQQNYLMHVAHCARNMAVCPVCGDAVPKARLKEHRQQQHALVECPACRNRVQAGALDHHRATSCGRRVVACQYCELELPQSEITEHEYHCGARTERCEECSELVMHKYKRLHLDSNHGFLKLNDEPGPTPSWETPTKSKKESSPIKSRKVSSGNLSDCCSDNKPSNRASSEGPPPRDLPRTFVPAYDASEDLRAKVKLARHDLNNIKKSYIKTEERDLQRQQLERMLPVGPDLPATNRRPRDRFVTNLVPYEKNKSFEINALPLQEREAALGALPSGEFNYLGVRENLPPNALPVKKLTNGTSTTNSNTSSGSGNLGAVPRRKKGPAPPPPVSVPSTPPTPTSPVRPPRRSFTSDEVMLPCEFCEKMIEASNLVQHETACRPDLAQLRVKEEAIGFNNCSSAAAEHSPEVQLPCEFCSGLYPASKLLSHQALCDV